MDKIINPLYLEEDNIKKIHTTYKDNIDFQSISLANLFTQKFYNKILGQVNRLKYLNERKIDKHSFGKAKVSNLHLLNNKELVSFISKVLKKRVNRLNGSAYTFAWKDYKLIDTKEKAAIDFILDFTPAWANNYGGTLVYKKPNGDFMSIPSSPNTLTIIRRKGNDQRYMKYVNNLSKGKKRYIIIGTIN